MTAAEKATDCGRRVIQRRRVGTRCEKQAASSEPGLASCQGRPHAVDGKSRRLGQETTGTASLYGITRRGGCAGTGMLPASPPQGGPSSARLAQRELDVAGTGREVHDEVVQLAPLRGRQQLLDEAWEWGQGGVRWGLRVGEWRGGVGYAPVRWACERRGPPPAAACSCTRPWPTAPRHQASSCAPVGPPTGTTGTSPCQELGPAGATGLAASPDTMGPRMMALPCPAKPKDTALTPSYSTGVMACARDGWDVGW